MKYKQMISKVLLALLTTSLISINSIDKANASTSPQTWNFNYTGSVQTFTAPSTGTYRFDVWGGQGGYKGGNGGYAYGEISLNKDEQLYIYVGEQPSSSTGTGGWNGGGSSIYGYGGGGGATDIRKDGTSLSNRVLVAGGGGGSVSTTLIGGNGGGLNGDSGKSNGGYANPGGGGTQTNGGSGQPYNEAVGKSGALGKGGNGYGGGGGGFYGGGGGGYHYSPTATIVTTCGSGGGGSSYIGGVKNGITLSGTTTMPSPSGSTETGHTGKGYAKITMLSNPNISGQITTVIGTFNSTTIDVSIPAVNSFTFNPNTNYFNVQNIQINNNTSAPVYASVKQIAISPTSEWIPSLISPTTYTDNGWNNLSQADTKSKVALGILAISNSNWLNGIQNQNIWSTDLTNGAKIGAIRTTSSVSITPTIKVGRAITNEKTLTSNYVFEFGLE